MTEAHFSGSKQSAADVSYALTRAGLTVLASTPESPRAASDFWTRARQGFSAAELEQGEPRDFRALLRDPQGTTRLLRVHQGGSVRVEDSGAVTLSTPPAQPPGSAGLSWWQSTQTGRSHPVFEWDGTELGFSDLVAFFQLHGNQLNSLTPLADAQGFPQLQGSATVLETEHVYGFEMTRRSCFTVSGTGTLHALSPEELRAGYRPVQ